MTVDRKDFLSFLIKPSGEVVPAMPHEEEFSVQQIRDHVAGYPELICETCDGFLLFRDRDAVAKRLPVNPLATCLYSKYAQRPCPVNGVAFLAHPDHVAPYWRRRLQTGTKYQMAAA
jgi:hypothetical protein